MKVAELEGATLDYWVARAMELRGALIENDRCWIVLPGREDEDEPPHVEMFSPSETWGQGGPIMERLGISTDFEADSASDSPSGLRMAYMQPLEESTFYDSSPLVAAMRAVVHWRFGDEVMEAG